MRRPRRLSSFAILVGGFVAACQLVAGIERVEKEDSPALLSDAGGELPDRTDQTDPCTHSVPPPPPARDDDPDHELAPFYVAMAELHIFGRGDGVSPEGFDLDNVCTCDDRPGSAHDGGASCVGTRACDPGGRGVDNGMRTLLEQFSAFLSPGKDFDVIAGVNAQIAAGERNLLFVISHYNGRANDMNVSVGIVDSFGIRDSSGCVPDAGVGDAGVEGGAEGDGGIPGAQPPVWCGKDKWTVNPAAYILTSDAPSHLVSAYVTDHKLVIGDDAPFVQIPYGDDSLNFSSPVMVATIVALDAEGRPRDPNAPPLGPADGNFRLDDGVLAGRVSASTIVALAGSLHVPNDGGFFCHNASFVAIKAAVCGAPDIASSKLLDFKPNAPCDAISATMTFRARPAHTGARLSIPSTPNSCVDAGGLSELYRCPAVPGGQ